MEQSQQTNPLQAEDQRPPYERRESSQNKMLRDQAKPKKHDIEFIFPETHIRSKHPTFTIY